MHNFDKIRHTFFNDKKNSYKNPSDSNMLEYA